MRIHAGGAAISLPAAAPSCVARAGGCADRICRRHHVYNLWCGLPTSPAHVFCNKHFILLIVYPSLAHTWLVHPCLDSALQDMDVQCLPGLYRYQLPGLLSG